MMYERREVAEVRPAVSTVEADRRWIYGKAYPLLKQIGFFERSSDEQAVIWRRIVGGV